jgi:hypothetical protein
VAARALVAARAGCRPGIDRIAIRRSTIDGPSVGIDSAAVDGFDAQREEVGRTAKLIGVAGPDQRLISGERGAPGKEVEDRLVAREQPLLLGPGAAHPGEDVSCAQTGRTDQRAASRERDRVAETIAFQTVARDQLLPFDPRIIRPGEEVGRTAKIVIPVSADQGAVSVESDRRAEVVGCDTVARDQLLLLEPGGSAAGEDVGRAAKRVSPRPPDDGAIIRERDGPPELVPGDAVVRDQLLLFGPDSAVPDVDVGGTARSVATVRPDQGSVGRQRNGPAEVVGCGTVARDQLLFLDPPAAIVHEDVSGTATGADRMGADDGVIARKRDRLAELIELDPVAGDQLLLLCPCAAVPRKRVHRAAIVALAVRPHQRGIARERDGPAKVVELRRVAGDQLLLPTPHERTAIRQRRSARLGASCDHKERPDHLQPFALAPRSAARVRVRSRLHSAAHNPAIGFAPVFTYASFAS